MEIESWNGNRPHDPFRVEELKAYMETEWRCPGVICRAILNGRSVCYDGNHRRLALNPNVPFVVVDVMFNATEELIMKEFDNVNRSVPVPDIYVKPQEDTKQAIETWVNEFCIKYHYRRSNSSRCNKPNFNRDALIQNISELLVELECTPKELFLAIEKLNIVYEKDTTNKRLDKKQLTPAMKDACKTSGLWLFAKARTISSEDIKKVRSGKWK